MIEDFLPEKPGVSSKSLWGWLGFGSEEHVKVTIRERRIFWWYGLLGSE